MNNKYRTLIIIILFTSKCVFGQSGKDSIKKETIWKMMKYDGASVFKGVKHVYTRPFHWKKDDLLTAGGIVLGTAILYSFDEESSDFFRKQEKDIPRVIKDFGWYFGKPQNNYMLSASIYGVGLFTRNEKVRHIGVLLIASTSAAGLIQSVSKNVIGRARPTTMLGKGEFKPFNSAAAYHSFPSGHSILSFGTAHAIAKQFDNWWIKGGIYTIGLISPTSRLWSGAHWLTDVTLGMVLSVVVVDSIDNYLKNNNRYKIKDKNKISWNLTFSTNSIGLRGTF